MAGFQWQQRLLRVLSRHNRTTILLNHHHHHHHHLPTPFPPSFSTTLEDSFRSGNKILNSSQSILDESHILDQLSDLLPIQRNQPSIPKQLLYAPPDKPPEIRAASSSAAADEFLAPEDKLRGIFLQKLRGKTAIEHALSNVSVDLTVDVFAKVVNRGNLSGEAMVIFFNWVIKQPEIPENDIHCYNIIVKALGRRKFFKHMMDILHDMNVQGVNPNSETLMIVMDSFVSSRQVSKAIQLFGKLEEIGSKCDTESLNVLLKCLCQRSHVGSASSVLHSFKGKIPFDITTYNVIIGGWAKFGSVSEMEGILKAMVMDGFSPDCLTFTYLLEGLGRAGQVDDAVQIFDNMKGQGCVPDTNTYNAMIANFISIKDFGECMKYYERMLKSDLEPNMETYAKLISAFLKARRVADALELFDEMLCRGIVPTTGTITSFVEPLCRYGPPHAAMMIYKKARKVGCRISLSAYKLLLMRLSRFGKCGMILSLWNEMQESGYSADIEVYEYVINGLCNIGQLENAVIVMEESLRKGFCPSRLIYSKLNHKLMALNKVDIAYKLFLKIKCARLDENARKYWRYNGWHF